MALTIPEIKTRAKDEPPLVCLTAYSMPMAAMLAPYVDVLLVGDSLGMVLYGMESTQGVTIPMMVNHGKAVVKGADRQCMVVVDMPYGSYEESSSYALCVANLLMNKTGCDAVKLEGGVAMADQIKTLVDHDIPVMGHVGLLPQSAPDEGGFKIKGKNEDQIQNLIDDIKAVEQAGAFAVVIEGVIEDVAKILTDAVSIPTIGIGASPYCGGQILVSEDMLGLSVGHRPKFVKPFADCNAVISDAAQSYANDVRSRDFPGEAHVYRKK